MTMRGAVLGVALAVTLACILVLVRFPFVPPLFVVVFWGLIVVAGVVFERFRYKAIVPAGAVAPPGWQETDEAFVDPETGTAVSVWFDPRTGDRTYVAQATPARPRV